MQVKKRNAILLGLMVLLLIGIVTLTGLSTTPIQSSTTLEDAVLESRALERARQNGLIGDPVARRAVRMTLGQWLAFSGGQLTEDSVRLGLVQDLPVLVLAIRGTVRGRGISPENYDNITIIVNAQTGALVGVEMARNSASMPIQIPLSPLTPLPPIVFPPTLPLAKPATLVPRPSAAREAGPATLTAIPSPLDRPTPSPTPGQNAPYP